MSDIRTEIDDIYTIEELCKSNDIKSVFAKNPASIKFTNKRIAAVMNGKQLVQKFYLHI